MPIECRFRLPRLTDDEMRAIDYRVMGYAFAVQNELGRLCDESVYQANLAGQLIAEGFSVRIEEPIVLSFRDFSTSLWSGDPSFQRLVTELVGDWGTCLDQANYSQAIVECLGGKDRVVRELPIESNGRTLGNQRFLLTSDTAAFRLTTFPDGPPRDYANHLRKLLRPSPLKDFSWVNVGRHRLDFQTVIRQEDL